MGSDADGVSPIFHVSVGFSNPGSASAGDSGRRGSARATASPCTYSEISTGSGHGGKKGHVVMFALNRHCPPLHALISCHAVYALKKKTVFTTLSTVATIGRTCWHKKYAECLQWLSTDQQAQRK